MESMTEVDKNELMALCAVDSNLYGRTFFSKTCRQDAPGFHREMDAVLVPGNRLVGFEVFRGGAKTTKLRLFASKRIAYGVSRTALMVGKSQDHAARSVEWLMKNVESNYTWAQFYGLKPGRKWTNTEIEIEHVLLGITIRVLAIGITGSVRGINIDDYRPDFILLDDPCDEENTATPEARQKIEELVLGALLNSLAPESEAPNAMMVLAQTPLDENDLIEQAMRDPAWVTLRFGCFDEAGESRWPARWSTAVLKEQKQMYVVRNQLSLWLREMECILINSENAAFRKDWLQTYAVAPEFGQVYIGVDPTPPPKDTNKPVNEKLDDAVIFVIKVYKQKIYILDYYIAKSPDPDEFVGKVFEFVLKYHPFMTGVETTLFQRMLKWYIEKEMQRRKQWFTITPVEDKRKKETRIIQTISRYASNGLVYYKPEHAKFLEQFSRFRAGLKNQRDDILDAFSIALDMINPLLEGAIIEGEYERLGDEETLALPNFQRAP